MRVSLPPLLLARRFLRSLLRVLPRSLPCPRSRSLTSSSRRAPSRRRVRAVPPSSARRPPPSRTGYPIHAGFTLVEVLVALFVTALGIAGAAALQILAVRAARDAAHLADATRLARSLAERMRANPRALALPDDASPYLTLDVDAAAGAGAPAAATPCYADADCDADALARFDVAEVAAALADLPGGRIRVCRDAVPADAAGLPAWPCDGAAGAPLVAKVGWRIHGETRTGAPLVVLPLPGAAP